MEPKTALFGYTGLSVARPKSDAPRLYCLKPRPKNKDDLVPAKMLMTPGQARQMRDALKDLYGRRSTVTLCHEDVGAKNADDQAGY